MALTEYQIAILKLLAERRKREKISYVAGGAALNALLKAPRESRDLDLFHDTADALRKTWESDRKELLSAGYTVAVIRETSSFVEAEIRGKSGRVLIEWTRDSAFRFFPLIEDDILGLTLHPFDLATNKLLAMAGRLEVRDWIDVMQCHHRVQPLGYLIWAACGKDPGINPDMLAAEGARLHYSQPELDALAFDSTPPDAALLSVEWKKMLAEAKDIIDALPEEHLGKCVVGRASGSVYVSSPQKLCEDLEKGAIGFHEGTIGGAWPRMAPG